MKALITTLVAFALFTSTYAQVEVHDSVYMGNGYTRQIYYSLANDSVGVALKADWDLGFTTTLMDAAIIVNHPKGVTVYRVPNQDTSDWATLDTSGIKTWQKLYNSDKSWSKGAFNISANPVVWQDFGWATYDEPSHNVYGDDSLYVLQTASGFKKLQLIIKEPSNTVKFRIADLDNSNDHVVSVACSSYDSKNFVYYNIADNQIIDIEPASATWDIVFTQYKTFLNPPGIYYTVSGVFSNIGVKVAELRGVDIDTVHYANHIGKLSSNLSEIGYDWATINMVTYKYDIEDSLVYFVKTKAGRVFKLWFTAFDEGTTGSGKIVFGKEEIDFSSSSAAIDGLTIQAAVYPNPSDGKFDLVYSASKNADVSISVFDLSGRNVLNQKVNVKDGLNVVSVTMNDIASGSYLVKVMQDGGVVNLKMMVTK